jgi:hypothetical protein
MQLLFLGDGLRDEAVIPKIVSSAVEYAQKNAFRAWRKVPLHKNIGYKRRLLFALREARDDGLDGVVATVDRDSRPRRERLTELESAREADRNNVALTPIKVAVGEAAPHVEAWLLDDPKAIRDALGLPSNAEIPNVRECPNPKDALHDIIQQCGRRDLEMVLLAEIAQQLTETRCNHRGETGFEAFLLDLKSELC